MCSMLFWKTRELKKLEKRLEIKGNCGSELCGRHYRGGLTFQRFHIERKMVAMACLVGKLLAAVA